MLETQMLDTEGTEILKTLGTVFNIFGQRNPLPLLISALVRQLHLLCQSVE
jgi:hypothetical protein